MRQPVPMQQTQQPAQPQGDPQIGERRTTRDGIDVVYDGRGWREVIRPQSAPQNSPLRQPGDPLRESSQDRTMRTNAAQQAVEAQGTARLADEFVALNRTNNTGGIWGLPFVQGGRAMVDPEFNRMRSIQEQLTPAQREAGSGAMSDRDVEMYRRSTLNVGAPGPANQRTARVLDAVAANQADYSAFLDEYARANGGSLAGASEMWLEYSNANPLFNDDGTPRTARTPWRSYFGAERQQPARQQPARPAPAQRQAPASQMMRGPSGRSYTPEQVAAARAIPGGARGRVGTATNPRMVSSPAEAQQLPPGTHFITPDGQVRVRQ